MTTMISNLPTVLIEEIFVRVPLKSLRAVRLTCKSWNTLSKSRSFLKLYISKTATREEESMMIAMMNFDLYLMRVVVDDVDPSKAFKKKRKRRKKKESIAFKRKPCFLDEQVKISQVFHCEGLLLCILKEDDTRIISEEHPKNNFFAVVTVVFLSTETLTGVLKKGTQKTILSITSYVLILQERDLGRFCLCRLALYMDHEREALQLYFSITNQIGMSLIYGLRLRLMLKWCRGAYVPHICDGFFIDEEKKIAMGFEEEFYRKTFIIIGEDGYQSTCRQKILVQIKKPARGKRKRQSSFEKRLFDQNMLRLEAFKKLDFF
ncbi:hypothetical protein ARALYDRAFT_482868 [Arabidopsis lyrata subsp. lyrata]|uniref:F-box domain-containing protein n=1 Tax=Arabidopsis lyrata subsp. lyrata TaxID=81972 RepID=D7LBP5_ARALL|nr:hypothetical protein ARALYDRAFT_482868 [Arabidopsis lyrata subsp. lyrata]